MMIRTVVDIDHRPPLYFSKVDIKSCFDSIDQNVLIDIINKVLSQVRVSDACTTHSVYSVSLTCTDPMQDEYLIRRYSAAFTTTGGKVHFKHKKFAENPGTCYSHAYDAFLLLS
jgi:retron-type reverse transcriptase